MVLLRYSHPILAFGALLLGLVSACGAVYHRAFVTGTILIKANGFILLLYPFVWAATEEYWSEVEHRRELAKLAKDQSETSSSGSKGEQRGGEIQQNSKVATQGNETGQPSPISALRQESKEASDRELIRQFVLETIAMEQAGELDLVVARYAPEVHYHGLKASRQEVLVHKRRHWKEWPVRKEKLTSDLAIQVIKPDFYRVSFESSFEEESRDTRSWVTGNRKTLYLINRIDGKFHITGRAEEISNRKSILADVVPKTTELETFDGRIIKIPADLIDQVVLESGSKHPKEKALALEAVNQVRLTLLAEGKRDIKDTMSRFAFEVKYFGRHETSESIWTDKENYFKKWPATLEKVTSKYRVSVSSKPEIIVTFSSEFSLKSADETVERSGDIDHIFKLIVWHNGKELRIKEQSGKVKNLKTKTPE